MGPVPKFGLIQEHVQDQNPRHIAPPHHPPHLLQDTPAAAPVFTHDVSSPSTAAFTVLPPAALTRHEKVTNPGTVQGAPSTMFEAPQEVLPNLPKPAPKIVDPWTPAPSSHQRSGHPTQEEIASWPPPSVGATPPADHQSGAAAPKVHSHTAEPMFAPMVAARAQVDSPLHGPVVLSELTAIASHGTAFLAAQHIEVAPQVSAQPSTHGEALASTIDWRFLGFVGLLAAYLPMLLRSLLGVRFSHPLGTTVIALFMVPLSFAVIAARRPRRTTIDDRHVDLVVGAVAAIASLVCAWVLPRSLGGTSTLWRPEWIALPFALFSVYTLMWGVRFAWDVRNSLLVALLASPLGFVPMLGRSFTPLSGAINRFGADVAGRAIALVPAGPSQFIGGTPERPIDARGLIDGRVLSVAAFVLMIALLLVSRVDGRSAQRGGSGRGSGLDRRVRKTGVLLASLATFWIVDLVITALALICAGFAPIDWARYPTSPVVGFLPTAFTLWTFSGWCRRFGLFLPSRIGVINSATKLPSHGPKSRSDHAITLGVLSVLAIGAIFIGIKPSQAAVWSVPPAVDLASPVAPSGWVPSPAQPISTFHVYYGTHSEWNRTRFEGPANSPIDQVNLDRVTSSIDLLRMFNASATYDLAKFRPVQSRTLDLGNGAQGIQETYYDRATASAWSVASTLIETPTGTHRISLSARANGDRAAVPLPKPQAMRNLLIRTSEPAPGIGKQLKDEKISRTADAVAELFRAYVLSLQSGALANVSGSDPSSIDSTFEIPDPGSEIASDAGFVQ